MNYKNEIEKIAAQVMPHRLADGSYAIPRYMEAGGGLGSDRDEMNMYLNDWNEEYGEQIYQHVPEGMTPFAGSGWEETLMSDEDGNLHIYDGYDGVIRALDDDEIANLYSTEDVDEKALTLGKSIPRETLSRLSKNYPTPESAYSMPPGGISDMGQVRDMMSESKKRKNSMPRLSEYEEAGLYDKALAKQDRRNALKKSIKSIPTALKWSAGGGVMGAAMGYDAGNTGKAALIGAGIGAGIPLAIGATNAIRNYKNAPRNHARMNAIDALDAVRMDKGNQEFLSQYKEASGYKADIEKIAGLDRDNDTETRFGRDRFMPGVKRLPMNLASGVAGALIGGGITRSPEGAAIGGALGNIITTGTQRHKALNKLNNKYFGEDASGKDKAKLHGMQAFNAATASGGLGVLTSALVTPEAIIQKKRREAANKGVYTQPNM